MPYLVANSLIRDITNPALLWPSLDICCKDKAFIPFVQGICVKMYILISCQYDMITYVRKQERQATVLYR